MTSEASFVAAVSEGNLDNKDEDSRDDDDDSGEVWLYFKYLLSTILRFKWPSFYGEYYNTAAYSYMLRYVTDRRQA